MELRSAAKKLAETIVTRDFDASRMGLLKLAENCNRCHQNFQVKVQIAAFDEKNPAP